MKKQKLSSSAANNNNPFDDLSDEIVFLILDHLVPYPLDSKSFYALESLHRHTFRSLRTQHLPSVLSRYSNISLSLCPRVSDSILQLLFSSQPLSNATEMRDAAAAALTHTKNLERLRMAQCKMVMDMGVGCVVVGCRKLKELVLKWCLGVGDLVVGLVSVKCKEPRTLDVSHLLDLYCYPSVELLNFKYDFLWEVRK